MHADSRHVSSNQSSSHKNLPALLRRHLAHKFRKPVAPHSSEAFKTLTEALESNPRPLVLDSFCGTGRSTEILATRHPEHLVVGVDKSAHRLSKHNKSSPGTYLLLQADCEDIWQLLLQAGFTVDFHYLLYPNPWPKSRHLQRRIHGSAAFPWLLQLGGVIELRSNWKLYIEEFELAMQLTGHTGHIFPLAEGEPMTLFEEKYRDSGHLLWGYISDGIT